MNEAANFVTGSIEGCPNNKYGFPPYKPSMFIRYHSYLLIRDFLPSLVVLNIVK